MFQRFLCGSVAFSVVFTSYPCLLWVDELTNYSVRGTSLRTSSPFLLDGQMKNLRGLERGQAGCGPAVPPSALSSSGTKAFCCPHNTKGMHQGSDRTRTFPQIGKNGSF